jgi:hypothetical protein
MIRTLLFALVAILASCSGFQASGQPEGAYSPSPMGETSSPTNAPRTYPLATCVVSGKRLEEDAVTFVTNGRTFRTCCADCQRTIEKDTELWSRQIDAVNIKGQLLTYPMTTCVVSGRALGANSVTAMHEDTLVRFCCNGCKDTFANDPTPHLARLATAKAASFGNIDLGTESWTDEQTAAFVAEQKPDYPLTTCPVSGKPIEDGKAVDLVLEGTLVRLCCKQCVDAAKKDATTIVTQVQSAAFTAQKSNYPLATCAISGKPLGDHSASTMVGTVLVRTCTTTCAKHIAEQRAQITATIRAARASNDEKATEACCGTGSDCCCATKDN